MIKGSNCKARGRFDKKLKFPGKNEEGRQELDATIIESGKWMEVSQLDTTALTQAIEAGLWSKELIDQIMGYGRIKEVGSFRISKLKDEEK